MSGTRLRITSTLRERMRYPKCVGATAKVLVFESRYWLDNACAIAAAQLGWQVERCPVVAAGMLPRNHIEALLTTLIEMRPDFLLTINLSGMDRDGLFAGLFEDLDVPLVTWFVDDPRTILMGTRAHATGNTIAVTWERMYLPYLQELGFLDVHWLPLAAEPTFSGEALTTPSRKGAFVGNSMVEFAAREGRALDQYPELAAAIHTAFEEGRVTRDTFSRGLAAIVGHDLAASCDAEAIRHAEMYCFVEGSRLLRHALAARLIPEGMQVYGDPYWKDSFPCAEPSVNYDHDLAAFYRECAVNVNSTSIQMATAVNQRVFDCPAAGGFLLTDAQMDMVTLFEPGVDATVYESLDECVDKFRFFTSNPKARVPLIAAARRRIASEHTYAHRLRTIAGWVRERFGA